MMTNQEELKTMIKCFRVHDLQALLSFTGRNKNGKKQELQERALNLLELNSQPLYLKIKQLYDSMQKGYKSHAVNILNMEQTNSVSSTTNSNDSGILMKKNDCAPILVENVSNEKSITSQSPTLDSESNIDNCPVEVSPLAQVSVYSIYQVHPGVKFKKLPFYEVLYELLKPSSLLPQRFHIQQTNFFIFYLTPQQAFDIYLSSDSRPGREEEYSVQVQLRFCLLKTAGLQQDSFPSHLVVRVNNKYCNIQEHRKKINRYGKELCSPINLTPLMLSSPTHENTVEVQWNTENGVAYAIGIFLVQKKTSEDLSNQLKAKGVRCSDYTRGLIKDKLKEEPDSEIVTTSLKVSLTCPLGKMKLKTPCRASTCQHLQCFDAYSYIQMNEKKPTWLCPVCDNQAEYDQLFVDGYFVEILSSDRLLPDVNEIELHRDGSWSSLIIKSENISNDDESAVVNVENENVVEINEDDVKCITSSKDEEEVIISINEIDKPTESEKRKVDEIDLTISDSEEELRMWYRRRSSKKNKKHSTESVSHLNPDSDSPSVIDLDSDSSDSLPLLVAAQCPLIPPLV